MARCPDCDSVEIFSIPERGDGNCSVCHGDGHGTFMDRLAEGIGGSKSCFNCGASGKCPTCGGSGVVADD